MSDKSRVSDEPTAQRIRKRVERSTATGDPFVGIGKFPLPKELKERFDTACFIEKTATRVVRKALIRYLKSIPNDAIRSYRSLEKHKKHAN